MSHSCSLWRIKRHEILASLLIWPSFPGLGLDTSKEGLLPQSPAISGVSSPGSALLSSPGIRFSSSPTSHHPYSPGVYSPGVDSPGSWREELEFTRPVNETLNASKAQTNTSRDTTAAEEVFGPGCFSCFAFFGGKKKRDAADSLNSSRATTRPGSPQTPTSPHKKALQEDGRLRLGIVIAHYRDPRDEQKKIHVSDFTHFRLYDHCNFVAFFCTGVLIKKRNMQVVYGMSEDGAAQRSCLVQVGMHVSIRQHMLSTILYFCCQCMHRKLKLSSRNRRHCSACQPASSWASGK